MNHATDTRLHRRHQHHALVSAPIPPLQWLPPPPWFRQSPAFSATVATDNSPRPVTTATACLISPVPHSQHANNGNGRSSAERLNMPPSDSYLAPTRPPSSGRTSYYRPEGGRGYAAHGRLTSFSDPCCPLLDFPLSYLLDIFWQ